MNGAMILNLNLMKMQMNRIKSLSQKLLREFVAMSRYYGVMPALYTLVWWLNFYIPSPVRFRLSKWALMSKTRWLDRYVERNYSAIIEKYRYNTAEQKTIESPVIWVFWGQGESQMPTLIKACYEKLKENNPNVKLLTNDNLSQYLDLHPRILEKVRTGVITWAHFSDVVRTSLLAKYGGLWLDATLWVPSRIPFETLLLYRVYSANSEMTITNRNICFWTSLKYSWSGWCIWANHTNSTLFGFVSEMLSAMVVNEKMTLDYVLIDYLINYAITHFPEVEQQIEQISKMRCNQKNALASLMNEPYDEQLYRDLCATDNFFKLSFRSPWKSHTIDGKLTFYGKLIYNKA